MPGPVAAAAAAALGKPILSAGTKTALKWLLPLLFGPGAIKAGTSFAKSAGRGWGELIGAIPGAEEAEEAEQKEQARFLGMLEEKIEAEEEREPSQELMALMTLINTMAPQASVQAEGLGEPELAGANAASELSAVLSRYGAEGRVSPERLRASMTRQPTDARMLPFAALQAAAMGR